MDPKQSVIKELPCIIIINCFTPSRFQIGQVLLSFILVSAFLYRNSSHTVRILKFQTPQKFAVTILKLEQYQFTTV